MSRLLISLCLGVLVAASGLVAYFGLFGFDLEENIGLQVMLRARSARPVPEEVVVIDLDKPAADRLGLALDPDEWPRTIHARLVDRLSRAGAAVIVFDVFFREARGSGQDDVFAEAIRRAGNVVLFGYLRRETAQLALAGSGEQGAINLERLVPPTPAIAAPAAGLAPFVLPKRKARVSQFWTFRRSAGDMPSLPAVALQLYALDLWQDFLRLLQSVEPAGAADLPPRAGGGISGHRQLSQLMDRLQALFAASPGLPPALLERLHADSALAARPDDRRRLAAMIRLYQAGDLHYLNFYGPPHTLTTVSYADALQSDALPLDVRGKVVFIGYSAGFQPDQKDGFYSVYSQPDGLDLSGVEIAATAFANLLDRSTIEPLAPLPFILIVIAYGLLAALAARRTPLPAIGLGVLLPLVYAALCLALFQSHQLWLPVAVPVLIQSPVALVAGLAAGYWETNRERDRIRQAFGHYIPDRVVDQLLRSPGAPHAHHELHYGICLATDAEQYTGLAESMPPAALQHYMNRYYTRLFEPVGAQGGVVSDVIGDAMLAIWSASQRDPALRARACRAALAIARSVDAFNRQNKPALPTRIGLHAGELALGHVGALDHFEYRAVGDIVNTAARIEGVNKMLGTRILASSEVVADLPGFVTREVGSFRLAGKRQALTLCELIGETHELSPDLQRRLERFGEGLEAYRDRDWERAVEIFSALLQLWPADGPAKYYEALCSQQATAPASPLWTPTIALNDK